LVGGGEGFRTCLMVYGDDAHELVVKPKRLGEHRVYRRLREKSVVGVRKGAVLVDYQAFSAFRNHTAQTFAQPERQSSQVIGYTTPHLGISR